MSPRAYEPPVPAELEHADELLEKAEALIRRHQGGAGETDAFDDLPVLTEVVAVEQEDARHEAEVFALEDIEHEDAAATAPAQAPTGSASTAGSIDESLLVERLIGLDAKLTRAIEDWMGDELPQILAREFEALSERIREEALAHLRATLIPALSQDISAMLDPEAPDED